LIDAELGRIKIDQFEIREGSEKVFTTRKDVFPETGPREAFKSPCLRELLLLFAIDESFRKGTDKLNRVLLRKEGETIQFRTVANTVEREGELIEEERSKKAEEILKRYGFDPEGQKIPSNKGETHENEHSRLKDESISKIREDPGLAKDSQSAEEKRITSNEGPDDGRDPSQITEERVKQAIEELNLGKEKELQIDRADLHETFEDPKCIKANISLDDVLAKKQKEADRKKNAPSKEKRAFVKNTVAHLENGEKAFYVLNAPCVEKILILVFAFLLYNGLLNRAGQLIFFIDGAADLRLAIQSLFLGLLPFKIILDWFHLEKKCKERLSMAMKGKVIRNKVLDHIIPLLWHGKVETAIAYLQDLNKDDIKNQEDIKRLIGYFERNMEYIPCYVLRQKLGLRVSSNRGEKANDLAVSSRQKHNGMSWSTSGSTSLATVTTLHLNHEQSDWLLHRKISFHFGNSSEKVAA